MLLVLSYKTGDVVVTAQLLAQMCFNSLICGQITGRAKATVKCLLTHLGLTSALMSSIGG